jgi:phosphoglycerate dehydrogenase-like enzyme
MPTALYFKPSWETLQDRIRAIAPELRVALWDEAGRITLDGKDISLEALQPDWFWIHSEMFHARKLKPYFELMLNCPSIKWLHTVNTGLDSLPYLELVERGITVTNNHAQAVAIAEFVVGQVLAHYQMPEFYRQNQVQGLWKPRGFREISGTRWLVIGFGEIGRGVASRVRAFGATVTAVRRKPDGEGLADHVVQQDQLHGVLPQADVVVLACASNPGTRHMVDAAFLGAMKDSSVLVNIARGDLVVEEHLHKALDAGKPSWAILDVFNQEPPAPDSWVWQHPAVSLTPHCSNGGSGMRSRSDANFLDNLGRMTRGEQPNNLVSVRDIL